MTDGRRMGAFWDARAREDALFFVDDRRAYGSEELESFWAGGERDLDAVLAAVGARVEPHEVVVDLGCGVGRLTRVLAGRARGVRAIDVSSEMLSRAGELRAPGQRRVDPRRRPVARRHRRRERGRRHIPCRLPAHPRFHGHTRLRG